MGVVQVEVDTAAVVADIVVVVAALEVDAVGLDQPSS